MSWVDPGFSGPLCVADRFFDLSAGPTASFQPPRLFAAAAKTSRGARRRTHREAQRPLRHPKARWTVRGKGEVAWLDRSVRLAKRRPLMAPCIGKGLEKGHPAKVPWTTRRPRSRPQAGVSPQRGLGALPGSSCLTASDPVGFGRWRTRRFVRNHRTAPVLPHITESVTVERQIRHFGRSRGQ